MFHTLKNVILSYLADTNWSYRRIEGAQKLIEATDGHRTLYYDGALEGGVWCEGDDGAIVEDVPPEVTQRAKALYEAWSPP